MELPCNTVAMYITEKKLTKGVSDHMKRPARRNAITGSVTPHVQARREATNVSPNVEATMALRKRLERSKFIATLEPSEMARRIRPVFVK